MPRTARIGILDFGRIRAQIKGPDPREEQALATHGQTVLSSFEDVENALVAYPRNQFVFVARIFWQCDETHSTSLQTISVIPTKPELARSEAIMIEASETFLS